MKVLAGIHAVKHALEAGEAVETLLVEKGKQHPRLNELVHLARKAKVRVSFVPKEALARRAEGVPHQGVVAEVVAASGGSAASFEQWLESVDVASAPVVLLLDQVTDPHNLGACIRTAEAAGCMGIVIPKDHAADLNSPVVAKSACGALSRLPVMRVTNLNRAIQGLQEKGFWIVGLAGEAQDSLYDARLDGALGIVMGAEGKGLRRLVSDHCDHLVKIPMPGHVESLNVSVATGVTLFEIVRRRESN